MEFRQTPKLNVISLSSVCLRRNRNCIPYTDRYLSPRNVKPGYEVTQSSVLWTWGNFYVSKTGRHVRLSHIYMDVQAEYVWCYTFTPAYVFKHTA